MNIQRQRRLAARDRQHLPLGPFIIVVGLALAFTVNKWFVLLAALPLIFL